MTKKPIVDYVKFTAERLAKGNWQVFATHKEHIDESIHIGFNCEIFGDGYYMWVEIEEGYSNDDWKFCYERLNLNRFHDAVIMALMEMPDFKAMIDILVGEVDLAKVEYWHKRG